MSEPLLSVCLITYNHANYIKEAIDGVLMQKVNFSWELIIADDCSTDGTREIILDYKKKYPDLIKLILQEKNVGAAQNWMDLITNPKSKYIAYFEGDDYWIDALKLQKQIDFLEENAQYSLCFHNSMVVYENSIRKPHEFVKLSKNEFTIEDIISTPWFIPSQSILFRKELSEFPLWTKYVFGGDMSLQLILATKGKFWGIDEVMSVYRKTSNSISSGRIAGFHIIKRVEALSYFNSYTNFKYNDFISTKINSMIQHLEADLIFSSSKFHKLINPLYYFYKLMYILSNIKKKKHS